MLLVMIAKHTITAAKEEMSIARNGKTYLHGEK